MEVNTRDSAVRSRNVEEVIEYTKSLTYAYLIYCFLRLIIKYIKPQKLFQSLWFD